MLKFAQKPHGQNESNTCARFQCCTTGQGNIERFHVDLTANKRTYLDRHACCERRSQTSYDSRRHRPFPSHRQNTEHFLAKPTWSGDRCCRCDLGRTRKWSRKPAGGPGKWERSGNYSCCLKMADGKIESGFQELCASCEQMELDVSFFQLGKSARKPWKGIKISEYRKNTSFIVLLPP